LEKKKKKKRRKKKKEEADSDEGSLTAQGNATALSILCTYKAVVYLLIY
jgi:hypothetical protein